IANPFDRVSFFRIINVPSRGLGDKFETDFYTLWNSEPFSTWQDIIKQCYAAQILTKIKITAIEHFINAISSITPTSSPSAALEQIITRINYIDYIKN